MLKYSPYKWLDPIKLAKLCCQVSAPESVLSQLNGIYESKYFTAKTLNNSAFDPTAGRDQAAYHRALERVYSGDKFEIILGYHTVNAVIRRKVDELLPKSPHAGCEKTKVWNIEEKQTDVNIAIHSLKDAYTDPSAQLHIFVSNDSDLAPLVEMLAALPNVRTGIIAPIKDRHTRPTASLVKHADWSTGRLSDKVLRDSQLPLVIETSKKNLRKPIEWFGESALASEILDHLIEGLGKRNAAYKWLEQQPFDTDIDGLENLDRPAIEMLDSKSDAKLVLAHAKAYVDYIKNRRSKTQARS